MKLNTAAVVAGLSSVAVAAPWDYWNPRFNPCPNPGFLDGRPPSKECNRIAASRAASALASQGKGPVPVTVTQTQTVVASDPDKIMTIRRAVAPAIPTLDSDTFVPIAPHVPIPASAPIDSILIPSATAGFNPFGGIGGGHGPMVIPPKCRRGWMPKPFVKGVYDTRRPTPVTAECIPIPVDWIWNAESEPVEATPVVDAAKPATS